MVGFILHSTSLYYYGIKIFDPTLHLRTPPPPPPRLYHKILLISKRGVSLSINLSLPPPQPQTRETKRQKPQNKPGNLAWTTISKLLGEPNLSQILFKKSLTFVFGQAPYFLYDIWVSVYQKFTTGS